MNQEYKSKYFKAYELVRNAIHNKEDYLFLNGLVPLISNEELEVLLSPLKHSLTTLNLSGNSLKELPLSINSLSQIRHLDLSKNNIEEINGCKEYLENMRSINISQNLLLEFPATLFDATNIISLNISNNQIEKISSEIDSFKNIQLLDCSYNQLKDIPESIGALSNLTYLNLYGNDLHVLPDSISNCNRLTTLHIKGNSRIILPPEIFESDAQTILDFYFRKKSEVAKRLNEAKILVIGQGGVGKTSLIEYIVNKKSANPEELPTEGIIITDWLVNGKKGVDNKYEKISVHIWDFGGQEIMHATHQFFLTKRSLYVIVIDSRSGEKESNIHYWLKIVNSYGGNSPVLIVANKCDHHYLELNKTSLLKEYPNISDFIQTSCVSGNGISDLRKKIGVLIRKLPHVFDELPSSYFTIKQELTKEAGEKNYLHTHEYFNICNRHKLNDQEEQERLIRFLHDLGVVLNFQDDEDPYCQNDPYILNPEWVTKAVYAIIMDKDLRSNKNGVLTKERLSHILSRSNGYPKRNIDFIIRKMMQFELAYELDRNTNGIVNSWLIPELLDPNEPNEMNWHSNNALNFQYSYSVLPSGLICRLIVLLNKNVDLSNTWRTGTVLNFEENHVFIKGDIDAAKTFISVHGKLQTRREALAIVRNAFDHVHRSIPALKANEEIPLPDDPSISVPYTHLKKLEDAGEMIHFPVGAEKAYRVEDLLNGVDSLKSRKKRYLNKIKKEKTMPKNHIFISYCRENIDQVQELVKRLEEAGENIWWDQEILVGQDWQEQIQEAMKKAYAVIICISSELTEGRIKSGVYPEIRDAIKTYREFGPGHAYIFPVRLNSCKIPPIEIDDTRTLRRLQHIDIFPESRAESGLEKLLTSLRATKNLI